MNTWSLVVVYILLGSPPSGIHTQTITGLHQDECQVIKQQHLDTFKLLQYGNRMRIAATCRKW